MLCCRAEGEALAKRSGDQEATLRRLRTTAKDLEAERDKLQARAEHLNRCLSKLKVSLLLLKRYLLKTSGR